MAVLRAVALRQPGPGQPNWRVPGRGGSWAKRILATFEAALEAARSGEVAAPLGAGPRLFPFDTRPMPPPSAKARPWVDASSSTVATGV